jgi:hypothetical protein
MGTGKGKARSTGKDSCSTLLGSRHARSSGSQDSLDRVRVSRSNAGSPSGSGGGTPLEMQSTDLSDVDEGEGEGRDSPGSREVDGGSHMQQMMHELAPKDAADTMVAAPVAA